MYMYLFLFFFYDGNINFGAILVIYSAVLESIGEKFVVSQKNYIRVEGYAMPMLHLITESPYLALFSRMLNMFLRIYPTSLGAGGFVVIKFLVPTMFCCVELSLSSAVMFPPGQDS